MWGHRRDRRAWRRRRRLRSRGRLARAAGFDWAAELAAREAAVLVAGRLAPAVARRSAAEQELAAMPAAAPAAAAERSALRAGRQE